MKIVIDINENDYHRFVSGFANEDDSILLENLFKNGTPITDGDLISRHELLLAIEQQIAYLRSVGHDTYLMGLIYSKQYVSGAPAIGEENEYEI